MLPLWQERKFTEEFFKVQADKPRPWRPFWRLGDKMKLLEYATIMVLSLPGTEIWRTFERILSDVMPCLKSYKYTGAQTSESISLEFCPQCSLVS
ncbi:hypothetical protein AVEN_238705-1 [Araneus ventricosus]|uniref:Uncharacterized protein n=1 Tax=Araneus ventricosus TaxID=182803 RepID=A0A4Y2BXZ6_ARAVE|nr:hypothetical protein AVEN_238705-1 [Araneus ventricosus]